MNSKLSSIIICLLLCLFFAGCRTYQPPQRPLAYMFPTLVPGDVMRRLSPQTVSTDELRRHLTTLGVWDDLVAAGLHEIELQTLIRGLQRRGYGELDARRCDCRVRWVSFSGVAPGRLRIVVSFGDDKQVVRTFPTLVLKPKVGGK